MRRSSPSSVPNQPIRHARLCKKTIFQALCFFRTLNPSRGIEGVKPGTAKKAIFRDLKNCFFGTALVKLRQARLCKKIQFLRLSKNVFFRMPLVKSANSTSLPRFSSLQIAQMPKNLKDPRPIVVEICLHLKKRI